MSQSRKRCIPFLQLFSLIFVFVISQTLLFLNKFEIVHIYNKKIIFGSNNNFLEGDMFFSGDLEGLIEECVDCQGNKRLIPKLSNIIKSSDNYLYFDIGDFSANSNEANNAEIPFLLDIFNYLRVSAINLTKKDFLFLGDFLNYNYVKNFKFISANLKLDPEIQSNIDEITFFPFEISNKNKKDELIIAVTGISDNRRLVGKWTKKVLIRDQVESLKEIKKRANINIDFLILLYHDSLKNLKKLLANFGRNEIDLVVGCYGNFISENINYINKIPYIYIGNRGKFLANVKVCRCAKHKYFIKYRSIKIWNSILDDSYVLNIIKMANDKFKNE